MKNVLFLLLMTLLAVSISFAQLGLKAGINIGTFGGDDKGVDPAQFNAALAGLPKVDPIARVGFVAGASYKVGLLMGLSIQPEVLYSQKGAVYELSAPPGYGNWTAKSTVKLSYIDIPVLVKFSLPVPLVSPYLEGGVSYSILLSAKETDEYTVPGLPSQSEEQDIKDGTTKNDLSFVVGVGIQVLIIDIDARYNIGTTKLQKDFDTKMYNRGFALTLGLRF
jgi:hypothetical protein